MKKIRGWAIFPPILLAFLIVCGLTVAFLPDVTFTDQEYSDIIYGLSALGTNKTGELNLFKGSLALACVVAGAAAILIQRKQKKTEELSESFGSAPVWIVCLIVMGTFFALNYEELLTYSKLLIMGLFYLAMWALFRKKANLLSVMAVCVYYTVTALIATANFVCAWFVTDRKLPWDSMEQWQLCAVALVPVLVLLMLWKFTKKEGNDLLIKRSILWMQLVIPLNFLIWCKDRYLYEEEIVRLAYPAAFYVLMGVLMGGLILVAVRRMLRYDEKAEEGIAPVISVALIVTIFAVNSYIVPAQIVPSDFWHHGEQISAWHQLIEWGQGLYTDFAPSSGLFALPIGFVMMLLGGGANVYATAYSLVSLLFAVLTAVLMAKAAGKQYALPIALLSGLMVYNRGYFVLPYLLILTMPRLIERRSAWLKAWILLSLLAGLYYPTVGMALLVATLPFGIIQAVLFFKNGEFTAKKRSPMFWTTTVLVLGICLASLVILLPMAKYILTLAGQSLEADSFTLLAYTEYPDNFLSGISNDKVRYLLYLIIRVFFAASTVVIPFVLLVLCLAAKERKRFVTSPLFLVLSASILFTLVFYSYSLVRADTELLLARTGVTTILITIYLIVGMAAFGKEHFTPLSRTGMLGVLLALLTLVSAHCGTMQFPNVDLSVPYGGVYDDTSRLISVFEQKIEEENDEDEEPAVELTEEEKKALLDLSSTYVKIDEEITAKIPKLKEGFISKDVLKGLMDSQQVIDTYGLSNEYFANLPRFYYSILEVKAPFLDSTALTQSVDSQEMVLEYYEENPPIFAGLNMPGNYELLKWAEDHNYQVLNNGWWVSPEIVEKYGMQDIVVSERIFYGWSDYGKHANSFGRSIESLQEQFDRTQTIELNGVSVVSGLEQTENGYVVTDPENAVLQIDFAEPIDGKELDYIYLNLSHDLTWNAEDTYRWDESLDRRIFLSWSGWDNTYGDHRTAVMVLGSGELLIPIGLNTSWRYETQSGLRIKLSADIPVGTVISLEELTLYGRR